MWALTKAPLWLAVPLGIALSPYLTHRCRIRNHWLTCVRVVEYDPYTGEFFEWRQCAWCATVTVEPHVTRRTHQPAQSPAT
jgi:hypothetical protein